MAKQIIKKEETPKGLLEIGKTDPVTSKRFEKFTPTINADVLKPVATADFKTVDEAPVFPVQDIDTSTPPLEPTKTEAQAQGFTEQLQSLQKQLVGESAFRAEQEKAIPELQATQADLTQQLKAIQAEAKAIPLQLQKEATGRGITTGGLRPLQTARLRENAIQALAVNSLLEASRGNLATAQSMADRAVAQKFDPIREEINAITNNLNLILQSPQFSLEQKNRAQKQLDIQNAKLRQAQAEEQAQKRIYDIGLKAAQANVDAVTLQQIQQARTPEQALQIAQQAGVFAPAPTADQFTLSPGQTRFDEQGNIIASVVKPEGNELDELLSPNELALFNAPAGSTMRDVMGQIPKEELTGVQKFNQEIALGKEFENLIGDSRKAATAITNINSSLVEAEKAFTEGTSANAASQGILIAFNKLLDPTSVVRESEYARSGNGQSLFDRMEGTWDKILQGGAGVTIEELRTFVDTANVFLKGYENTALKHAKRMKVISERQGLDLNSILTEDMVDLINKDEGSFDTEQEPTTFDFTDEADFLQNATDEQLQAVDDLSVRFGIDDINDLLDLMREQQGFSGDLSRSENGLKQPTGGIQVGKRTDRHNNPTAFTIAIAKQAGLKEGKDYEAGDQFPNNPRQRTAILKGDPLKTTIKVIDKIGFFTANGKPRWTHTQMSKKKWDSLSYQQKKKVIKEMYNKEGNNGKLLKVFG